MSVNTAKEPTRVGSWEDADDIDLTRYIAVVRRRWLEIILITMAVIVLTGVSVWLYRKVTPPVYEATATAAIVRTLTDVRFDDRFTTSSDQPNLDVNSRRAALVAMVQSGTLAEQVIVELGDQLPVELREPAALLNAVRGGMATANGRATQSDLINITVRAPAPAIAAAIANAWTEAYVRQVNSVYGQVPDDMLGSVATQLVEVQDAYSKAQANLESYLAASKLDALTRQSNVISQTVGTLQASKVQALNAYMNGLVSSYSTIMQTYLDAQTNNQMLAFDKEQEGQRARIAAYLDAYNAAQVDTFTGQSDRDRAELRTLYDQWLRTNSLLTAARTLRAQAATGSNGNAASTALALQVLNLQLVNNATVAAQTPSSDYLQLGTRTQQQKEQKVEPVDVPGTVQVPLQIQLNAGAGGVVDATDLRQQVEATVSSVEGQLAAIEENIFKLNQSMLSGSSFHDLNAAVPPNSELVQAIADAYPSLFRTGVFSDTTWQANSDGLLAAGQAQAGKFLDFADALPTADSPDAPMAGTIANLEEQLRQLQGEIEIENARLLKFTKERDLAWESVQALSNKQAELQLARAAGNSEVRLFGSAVPLNQPVPQVSLVYSVAFAAVIGLLLGIVVAFVRELMGSVGVREGRLAETP